MLVKEIRNLKRTNKNLNNSKINKPGIVNIFKKTILNVRKFRWTHINQTEKKDNKT